MNLLSYRTRVARAIGMSLSDSTDTSLIDGWVNEGVVQFLRETKANQKTAVLAVTGGSGDYTLDTDILSLTDLYYEPANAVQNVMLEPVDSREIRRMRLSQSTADVSPRYYALQGAHLIMLYPNPGSSSDKLHLIYTPRPAGLAATGDSPSDPARGNIPEEYHQVIEAYAKWKAAEAEDHRPSEYGLNFQAEYERSISKVRADLNRKSGVFLGRAIPGRRPTFPLTNGTDIR